MCPSHPSSHFQKREKLSCGRYHRILINPPIIQFRSTQNTIPLFLFLPSLSYVMYSYKSHTHYFYFFLYFPFYATSFSTLFISNSSISLQGNDLFIFSSLCPNHIIIDSGKKSMFNCFFSAFYLSIGFHF